MPPRMTPRGAFFLLTPVPLRNELFEAFLDSFLGLRIGMLSGARGEVGVTQNSYIKWVTVLALCGGEISQGY